MTVQKKVRKWKYVIEHFADTPLDDEIFNRHVTSCSHEEKAWVRW